MKYSEQWLLYLALNILFIWKYMSRTAYSPLIGIVILPFPVWESLYYY